MRYGSDDCEDENQADDEALRFLQWRNELTQKVQDGLDDLDAGHFTEYDETSRKQFHSNIASTCADPAAPRP